MDPVSMLAAGATIADRSWAFLSFLWSHLGQGDVMAAYFEPTGVRIDGDTRLAVGRLDLAGEFAFRPVEVPGFELIPYSTDPYLEIMFSDEPGGRAWRWVDPTPSGFVYNKRLRRPSVATRFVLVGYRPTAILRRFAPEARNLKP